MYGSRARSSASQVTKVIEHTVLAPTCKIDLVQNKTECKFVVVQLKMFFTEEYFHRKTLPEITKKERKKKDKKRGIFLDVLEQWLNTARVGGWRPVMSQAR